MATTIIIEPAPLEGGLYRAAYEALVSDLREAGFEAELRAPIEERGGLPQEMVNAALWLGETVGEETIGAIIGIYVGRMQRSRRGRRRPSQRQPAAVLYGPDGERLRTIEIRSATTTDLIPC